VFDIVEDEEAVRDDEMGERQVLGIGIGDCFKKRDEFIGDIPHHPSPEAGQAGD